MPRHARTAVRETGLADDLVARDLNVRDGRAGSVCADLGGWLKLCQAGPALYRTVDRAGDTLWPG